MVSHSRVPADINKPLQRLRFIATEATLPCFHSLHRPSSPLKGNPRGLVENPPLVVATGQIPIWTIMHPLGFLGEQVDAQPSMNRGVG